MLSAILVIERYRKATTIYDTKVLKKHSGTCCIVVWAFPLWTQIEEAKKKILCFGCRKRSKK